MGYEDEVKTRNTNPVVTLDLRRSVIAAMAAHRDEFRNILGSEPIIEPHSDGHTFTVATYGAGDYILLGQFSIQQLPGCCGIAVFYHSSVTTKFTRRGLGKLFLAIRQQAAILAGYTRAIATVLSSNHAEAKLLTSAGWIEVADEFKNNRTGNKVKTFVLDLL